MLFFYPNTLFRLLTICALLMVLGFSCNKTPAKVNKAMYYWKTSSWYIYHERTEVVQKAELDKLYLKYFEIENDPVLGAIPITKQNMEIRQYDTAFHKLEIIPTVYIQNNVFYSMDKPAIDELAENVCYLIEKYTEKHRVSPPIEYQMDCDWTPTTKDNYFYFLKQVKQISKRKISCTLRLYPYKFPDKMGVPPVDRVMLMCYNLMSPLGNRNKNSILDLAELEKYLYPAKKYPVPIDVALPVYSWMLVYNNNKFTDYIYPNKMNYDEILVQRESLWFEVLVDTVIQDVYLREGDMVKYEQIEAELLIQAIYIIKKNLVFEKEFTVSLFHLDENQLKRYDYEELSDIFARFSR